MHQRAQRLPQATRPVGEAQVRLGTIKAGSFLGFEQPPHCRLHGRAPADIDAQRAAVDRQLTNVVDEESVPSEQVIERGDRKVAEVLVIDRVELAVLDQVDHVGHLENRDPAGLLQQNGYPRHQAIEVRHMGEHVIGDDQIGGATLGPEPAGEGAPEEILERRHSGLDGGCGRCRRGIDAEHGNAALDEVLQHVAVVAGDLDHQGFGIEFQARDQLLGIAAGMAEQGARHRREIRVVPAKQDLGIDGLGDLDQAALRTEHQGERDGDVRLCQLLLGQQPIRKRARAEAEDLDEIGAATDAAGGFLAVDCHGRPSRLSRLRHR